MKNPSTQFIDSALKRPDEWKVSWQHHIGQPSCPQVVHCWMSVQAAAVYGAFQNGTAATLRDGLEYFLDVMVPGAELHRCA